MPGAGPGRRPLTCLMASTMVTVLPVPGGPKMRYGAGLDIPVMMCVTALHCSAFACSLRSNHLREQRLSTPRPRPRPSPRPLPPRGRRGSPGLEGAREEGLVAGDGGEEEAGQATLHGQGCSPVLDLQRQPAEGEGHVEPQVVHKLLLQPGKRRCERGTGTLPTPSLALPSPRLAFGASERGCRGPASPAGAGHHSLGGEAQPDLLQLHAVHVALVLDEQGAVPLAAQVGEEVVPLQHGRAVLGHAGHLCRTAGVMPGTPAPVPPPRLRLRTSRTSSALSCTMGTSCMS